MLNLISRLLFSRKKIEALSGIAAAFILQASGHDLTQPIAQVTVGFFGLLVIAQTVLDARWGSASDGSGNGGAPKGQTQANQAVAATSMLFLLAVIGIACATYSSSTVRTLAAEHSTLEAVSVQECEALEDAAEALTAGPDQALPLLGRAAEVERARELLGRQAVVCWEVVARKQGPGFDPAAEARVVESFRRSWSAASELVED